MNLIFLGAITLVKAPFLFTLGAKLILMKYEDFHTPGVVIYVKYENSEVIRKIYFA